MKKVYIGLFSVLLTGVSFAQIAKTSTTAPIGKLKNIGEVSSKKQISTEKGITLWQNDFSVPGDWTITNAGGGATPPHTLGDWAISTNVSEIPVAALTPAGHTTAANGYALINSDAAGDGQSQNATIYTTNSIDLTGSANVSLVFEQSHRRFLENTFVVVSNDNGATWTSFEVNSTMATNTNSPNPETVQVNISSVAGNQSQVKIGFNYQGVWDWFWAIDDVKITQTDDFDLALTGVYWGAIGAWGPRLPYYQTPLTQIAPITFGGTVQNAGAITQNDVRYNVAIPSASFTGVSPVGSVAPNGIDTLDATALFTPSTTVASYAVTSSVSSAATDATPANNTDAGFTIAITDATFSRDNGTLSSGSFNQGQPFEVGNVFDIVNDQDLQGVKVTIHPNANVGTEIFGSIYTFDAGGMLFYETGATSYVLTAGDLNTEVTLPIPGGFPLVAGTSYVVMVGSLGDNGASNDLVVGTAGVSEAQTSFYLDGIFGGGGTLFFTTATPMVRMSFATIGIEENTASIALNVYPNPASDAVNVSFTLTSASDVVINVTDLSGKVVATKSVANASVGTQNVELNTQTLSAGVYTVNFVSNNGISTKKLVIKK